MSVISGIPGSTHLCHGHWKSPTGYLKLSSVSHTAVKYVHFTLAAAILDFWRMLTSRNTGSCTIETLDTKNMGIAVEILLLCALEFEICLGVKIPPICQRTSQKIVAGKRLKETNCLCLGSQMSLQNSHRIANWHMSAMTAVCFHNCTLLVRHEVVTRDTFFAHENQPSPPQGWHFTRVKLVLPSPVG